MTQVKICGLTSVDEAIQCAKLGANAIGLVFYPKSPRNVSEDQAKAICAALPKEVKTVGVFVNESFSAIMHTVKHCGLKAVQLHGQESPELVDKLKNEGFIIIKALFSGGKPSFNDAPDYPASAFLVECAKGKLPGGNAITWNWAEAKGFGESYSLILAGGLSPDNVSRAIQDCVPAAVDVSSGVEASPGKKDLTKVRLFIDAVSATGIRTGSKQKLIPVF